LDGSNKKEQKGKCKELDSKMEENKKTRKIIKGALKDIISD